MEHQSITCIEINEHVYNIMHKLSSVYSKYFNHLHSLIRVLPEETLDLWLPMRGSRKFDQRGANSDNIFM